MTRSTRVVLAAMAFGLGLLALVFVPGGSAGCLGPLGVTAVQCARVTGIVPTTSPAAPLLVLSIMVAALLLRPPALRRRLPTLVAAVLAAGLTAVTYLVFRPRALEGWTSTGEWISVPRPLDGSELAALVIAASLAAAMLAAHIPRPARR